jgi:hypothetical protein
LRRFKDLNLILNLRHDAPIEKCDYLIYSKIRNHKIFIKQNFIISGLASEFFVY